MELSLLPIGDHKWKIPVQNGLVLREHVNAQGISRQKWRLPFVQEISQAFCASFIFASTASF
jgi:hypothetical protein